jgi:hypothetical protein
LVSQGLLDCYRLRAFKPNRFQLTQLLPTQLSVYMKYSCRTFTEHLERYGYGPHEFSVSEQGRREMDKPEYAEYDKQLGYAN